VSAEQVRVETAGATLACALHGEPGGPVVLCVHGFPDCARSFRHQVAPLVARGYRVVLPTLRGYAPSSLARDRRYDAAALGEDLCALASHFSRAPVRLVGHDWGAISAFAATALAPERFSHLCTVAVPHLRVSGPRFLTPAQLRRSRYIGLFQVPALAERRAARDQLAFVERLWRAWSPGFVVPAAELDAIKAALAPPDHLHAALCYYRALRPLTAAGRRSWALLAARTRVPALHVHGIDDGCVGVELCDGMERAYAAGIAVHRLAAAGHFVHQEQPERFNTILLAFLAAPRP